MFGVDDMAIASFGGAALEAVGGLMGNSSARKEAAANRDWQKMMSDSAHMREVRDLVGAGLNPMLSVNHGGASTPSGAVASQSNPFTGLGDRVNSAARLSSVEKMDAETRRSQMKINAEIGEWTADELESKSAYNDALITKTLQENANLITDNAIKMWSLDWLKPAELELVKSQTKAQLGAATASNSAASLSDSRRKINELDIHKRSKSTNIEDEAELLRVGAETIKAGGEAGSAVGEAVQSFTPGWGKIKAKSGSKIYRDNRGNRRVSDDEEIYNY